MHKQLELSALYDLSRNDSFMDECRILALDAVESLDIDPNAFERLIQEIPFRASPREADRWVKTYILYQSGCTHIQIYGKSRPLVDVADRVLGERFRRARNQTAMVTGL